MESETSRASPRAPQSAHAFQVDLRGLVDLLSHHLYPKVPGSTCASCCGTPWTPSPPDGPSSPAPRRSAVVRRRAHDRTAAGLAADRLEAALGRTAAAAARARAVLDEYAGADETEGEVRARRAEAEQLPNVREPGPRE